jgi:hypothetical protein
MSAFRRAERRQVKLKIAETGPSGSGKTYSALLMAQGIIEEMAARGQKGKIAVVDTESKSASLYADQKNGPLAGIDFDVLEIESPYTIAKYLHAIDQAEREGYAVLIIDSISHAWAGDGGLLSKKEALDSRGGNSYTNWAGITKEHEVFKAKLLACKIHLIVTMRSKQDYVLEVNDKGKQAPKKVGMAPIQRDGMEYEFTSVFDLAMDHNAVASKDRTSLFDGQIFKPTRATGHALMKWLLEGKAEHMVEQPQEEAVPQSAPIPVSEPTTPAPIPAAEPAAASLPQPAPAVSTPPSLPLRSGVPCQKCQAEMILAKSGVGYICPNSTSRGDGHSKFYANKLAEHQTQVRQTA